MGSYGNLGMAPIMLQLLKGLDPLTGTHMFCISNLKQDFTNEVESGRACDSWEPGIQGVLRKPSVVWGEHLRHLSVFDPRSGYPHLPRGGSSWGPSPSSSSSLLLCALAHRLGAL